ncbi:LysR family transcriptional regulator [Azorhizobium sp. AG788]|uniref:LysR family transcriptional regulator n=1 Tax=Azorhizobium sp. AG788 TaxID=2183897 RepID=UPI00313A331F
MMSRPDLNWDDQRAFLAVIDDGSLSAAARRLGLTQPTVRHRIEALERALGTPLFSRAVNGLVPTEEARALAAHVRRMELASEAFRRAGSAPAGRVAGTVRISVSEFIGIEVLPRMLAPLRAQHPALDLELVLSNASADILHQEADIAIRMHPPRQDALIARHLGRIPLGFFAAPDYVARHGRPETLADLAGHPLIGPDRAAGDLALVGALGAQAGVPLHFAIRTDTHPAQLAAARAGLGIAVVQVPIGERDLVRLLPDLVVHWLEVWIVAHEDLRRSTRIDRVFQHLADAFARFCV